MKWFRYSTVLVCCFLLSSQSIYSQDSCGLRISLLTCTPGSELYSVFGHNALRVVDSVAGTDIVYNYGTFNFDDPNFYTKFVRGKLLYFLSQQSFQNFKYEYEYYKRGITEQVFAFDCAEKKVIQATLFENIQEQNRYYKYDFLKDNCTTRLRDIIFTLPSLKKDSLRLFSITSSTYRDYLHTYLDRAKMPWTTLGIDLLLGLGANMKMNLFESMFLPDYLKKEVSLTKIGNKELVMEENIIVEDLQPLPSPPMPLLQPFSILLVISLLVLLLRLSKKESIKRFHHHIIRALFLITGLLGLILVFTWFGTDHQSFSYNINIIWTFPLNIVFFYMMRKQISSGHILFKIFSIMTLLLLFISFIFPGLINHAIIPLVVFFSYESWIFSRKIS